MIKCLECRRHLKTITESHCQYKHQMSLIQYRIKHPGAPTVSQEHLDNTSRAAIERENPGEIERKRVEEQEKSLSKAREYFQRIDPDGSKLRESIRRRESCLGPMHSLPEEDEENAST